MSYLFRVFERHPLGAICLFTAIMLLPHLSTLDVSIMEARNFITAREMVSDGHWLLTTMNGEARYEKPPLPTWLTAASGIAFGIDNLFGLRFPAVMLVMVIGCFVFLLSKAMLLESTHSLTNALIAVTSFYVLGIIVEAPWDIYAHGFMLMAIYYLFRFFRDRRLFWRHVLLAALFMGFSFASKGPIAFYALLLPFFVAYGFVYRFKEMKYRLSPLVVGLVLTFIISAGWYLYIYCYDPQGLLKILHKETGNWKSYNVRPFYYYWSFFVQSGLWSIPAFVSLLYPYLKSRVINLKAYRFSLLWTLTSVVLLSLVPEKKSRYLMPVLIPLAINTGFYLEYLYRTFKQMSLKRESWPVFFHFGIVSAIGVIFPVVAYFLLGDQLEQDGYYSLPALSGLFIVACLLMKYLVNRQMRKVFAFTVLTFALLVVSGLSLTKSYSQRQPDPVAPLKLMATQGQLKIYGLDYVSPEVIWHYGDEIPMVNEPDLVRKYIEADSFILVTPMDLALKENSQLAACYRLEMKGIVDLNRQNPLGRKPNQRKMSKYYLVTARKPG